VQPVGCAAFAFSSDARISPERTVEAGSCAGEHDWPDGGL